MQEQLVVLVLTLARAAARCVAGGVDNMVRKDLGLGRLLVQTATRFVTKLLDNMLQRLVRSGLRCRGWCVRGLAQGGC